MSKTISSIGDILIKAKIKAKTDLSKILVKICSAHFLHFHQMRSGLSSSSTWLHSCANNESMKLTNKHTWISLKCDIICPKKKTEASYLKNWSTFLTKTTRFLGCKLALGDSRNNKLSRIAYYKEQIKSHLPMELDDQPLGIPFASTR